VRWLLPATCAACAAVAAWSAELPAAWKHWRYGRPLAAPEAVTWASVTLPLEVWGQAAGSLDDLRLIDAAGSEVPYVLHARLGQRSRIWRDTELSEIGFVPGGYTQAVADLGAGAAPHNTLEVEIAERDFFTWAEIAASDDRATWRIVRERGPVYRFGKEGLSGSGIVSYPATQARWLRLRLLAADEKLEVRRVSVAGEQVEEPELVSLPGRLEREADAPRGESRWLVDFGCGGVPASAARFGSGRGEFHRPARIEASDDGDLWRPAGDGDIYRYAPREAGSDDRLEVREHLEIRFGESRGRFWRVTVFDRDDPPIEDLKVELRGTPRHVVFRPSAAGPSHRLLYGNGRAAAPRYELARLTTAAERAAAVAVAPGAEFENAAWVSSEPWSERNPAVLWSALVLAVVGLGWLALHALRQPAS